MASPSPRLASDTAGTVAREADPGQRFRTAGGGYRSSVTLNGRPAGLVDPLARFIETAASLQGSGGRQAREVSAHGYQLQRRTVRVPPFSLSSTLLNAHRVVHRGR